MIEDPFVYEYKCPTKSGYTKIDYTNKSLMNLYDTMSVPSSAKKMYSPSITKNIEVYVKPISETVELDDGLVEDRVLALHFKIQGFPSITVKILTTFLFPILFPIGMLVIGVVNWREIIQDFKDILNPKKNGKFFTGEIFMDFKKKPELVESAIEFISTAKNFNSLIFYPKKGE